MSLKDNYYSEIIFDGEKGESDFNEQANAQSIKAMKYLLDKYVLNELDGYIRLLFESNGSYFYVWINRNYEIRAIQFIISEKDAIVATVDKNIIDGEITKIPINRTIACRINENINDKNLDLINRIENDELPDVIDKVKKLFKDDKNDNKIINNEIIFIKNLPQSKKY